MRALWAWLRPELEEARGAPPDPDWLRYLPAYEQYENLIEGRAKGNCSHMAAVYNLFGTATGLSMPGWHRPSRVREKSEA